MKPILLQFNLHRSLSSFLCCFFFLIFSFPAIASNVLDEFSNNSYSNNNGSANWTTNWLEITEVDGATTGDVQVITDLGSGRLRISGNNKGVQREVNLIGATVATLTFDYRRESLDRGNEYVNLEISSDGGGSWTELVRFKGPNTDASYITTSSYDITAYISSNTRIRLLSSANLDAADFVYFDNIEINYTSPSLTHFEISHDGTADNCLPEQITITKHTAAHAIDTTYTGTITLTTSSANGNWTKTANATDAEGTLSAGALDSGTATYTFVAADNGSIILNLANTNVETLNINISDGTDSESLLEDADLTFSNLITENYRDEFSAPSYTNNNGSALWASDWLEIVEADGASSGDIQVSSGQMQISGSNKGVQRAIDLTAASAATLTLDHRRVSLNSGNEYVNLEISSDGGASWTELDRFKGPQNDASNQSSSYDITSYISATTRIRLLGSVNLDSTTDIVYFDNIEISASFTVTCSLIDHFSINYLSGATGSGVNCQAESMTISAHDASHNELTTYTGSIDLTTSTTNGDWTKTGTASDAFGVLTAGAADSGSATYTFDAADNGSVILNFKDTHTEITDLNVIDGVISETSNTAVANDDYQITFSTAGFNFLADAAKNSIGIQIGGKPSNITPSIQSLELQAIKTSDETGACEAAFTGATPLEIAFECIDPISCTGDKLFISTDGGTTFDQMDGTPELTYTNIADFDFGLATDTTAPLIIRYDDAGKIKLHARKVLTPSSEEMIGESNEFVVRPFGFSIDFSGQRAADYADGGGLDNSTGTNTSYAANAAGNIFTSAGLNFISTLTAVTWQAADSDVNGIPLVGANLTDNTTTQNFGNEITNVIPANITIIPTTTLVPNTGAVTNSANSATFSNGIGTKTLAWSEVGIVNLTTTLTNYLASGSDIFGNVQNVGRFIPDHFNTLVTHGCTGGSTFTYSGQPFRVTAAAMNGFAIPSTTANYAGAFAKSTTLSNSGDDSNFSNNIISATDFINGIAQTDVPATNPTTSITYTYPAKDTFQSIITLTARDTETPTATGTSEETTEIRSGRARLENVFGPELTSLTMPLKIEYYSDNTTPADLTDDGFILNTDDTCTTFDATVADLTNYTNNLSSGETTITGSGTVAAGEASISFSAPGAGNEGSVNLLLNGLSLVNQTPNWLTFNWNVDCDNADTDDDITTGIDTGLCGPYGTASFGLYRGDDRVIYWREVF